MVVDPVAEWAELVDKGNGLGKAFEGKLLTDLVVLKLPAWEFGQFGLNFFVGKRI